MMAPYSTGHAWQAGAAAKVADHTRGAGLEANDIYIISNWFVYYSRCLNFSVRLLVQYKFMHRKSAPSAHTLCFIITAAGQGRRNKKLQSAAYGLTLVSERGCLESCKRASVRSFSML